MLKAERSVIEECWGLGTGFGLGARVVVRFRVEIVETGGYLNEPCGRREVGRVQCIFSFHSALGYILDMAYTTESPPSQETNHKGITTQTPVSICSKSCHTQETSKNSPRNNPPPASSPASPWDPAAPPQKPYTSSPAPRSCPP